MRRIVNMRVMLVVAVCQPVIILLLYLWGIHRGVSVVLQVAYYILLLTTFILCIKRARKKMIIALVICLCLSAITSISYYLQVHFYHSVIPQNESVYSVSGTIDAVTSENGVIRNVTLKRTTINGQSTRGKLQIVFNEDDIPFDTFTLGYSLTAKGSLYKVELINGSTVNGAAYRKNLRYKLYGSYRDCVTTSAKPDSLMRIHAKLYKKLQAACGNKYGGIAYCMLTGDKNELDTSVTRLYSMAGIAHVLAVSGFHVGILCALLQFLLKRFHVGKIPRFAIITAILCLYTVFVGMSASVIRACIMCIVTMGILLHGERKDALSALCFAFSAILTLEPFLLFEAGFLMSFSAVFGLILFAQSFTVLLQKIKVPKYIAEGLASTLAVGVSVIPVTAYFFNKIQTYSVLFNLLLIPIIMVTFIFFIIALPFSLLFNIDILFRIGSVGFAFADIVIGIVDYLPFNNIYVFSNRALFVIYPLLFAASKFVMLPKKRKAIEVFSVFLLSLLIVIIPTFATLKPSRAISDSLIPVNGYGDVTSIIVDKDVTVIGDVKDVVALQSELKANRIRTIDTIVLNELTEKIGKGLLDLVDDFKVRKIVCPLENMDSVGLASLGGYKYVYALEEVDLPKIKSIVAAKHHIGYLYMFSGDITAISVGYSHRYTDIHKDIFNRVAIVRCFMYLNDCPEHVYLTNMPRGYLGKIPSYQFSSAEQGSYVYKVFTGDLLKRK